jgi:hypothetical protein
MRKQPTTEAMILHSEQSKRKASTSKETQKIAKLLLLGSMVFPVEVADTRTTSPTTFPAHSQWLVPDLY